MAGRPEQGRYGGQCEPQIGETFIHAAQSHALTGLCAQAAGAFVNRVETHTRHRLPVAEYAARNKKRYDVGMLTRLLLPDKGPLLVSPYT